MAKGAVPWRDRLHEFVCHRCGNCCRGEGYVWLTRADIRRIAAHLELTAEQFLRTHTRRVDGHIALLDRPLPDKPCIFYEPGQGCLIHAVKPKQCVNFPVKWCEEDAITYCRGLQRLEDSGGVADTQSPAWTQKSA